MKLALVPKYFEIDKEYSNYVNSGELSILKKGISDLSEKIQRNPPKIDEFPTIAEVEILQARITCIRFLENALLFKPIEYKQLEEARRMFAKYGFLRAYEGVNAIDIFANYLNHFSPNKDIEEITEEQEKELFVKLNPPIALDGMVTQGFAKMIAETLKPELYTTISKPITERVDEIGETLKETEKLSQSVLMKAQQSPNRLQTLLNIQLGELRQILLETADQLTDRDPQKAKEARIWYNYLAKGISLTADLMQIVTFLTGIPSLPSLTNSDIPTRVNEFLKRIKRRV